MSRTLIAFAAAILLAVLALPSYLRSTTLVPQIAEFSFDCAETAEFPAEALGELVQEILRSMVKKNQDGSQPPGSWGDRAVQVDVILGEEPEYFVPLSCGATGNCTWGLFSTDPPSEHGLVEGMIFYVFMRQEGLENPVHIEAFDHLGAGEGILSTYELVETRLKQVSQVNLSGESYKDYFKRRDPNPCPWDEATACPGGDGRSREQAIIVPPTATLSNHVNFQDLCIRRLFPGYQIVGGGLEHPLVGSKDKRVIDAVKLQGKQGDILWVYFDISSLLKN